MPDLHAAVADLPLAFVDVETTGLSPRYGDRVCEIAVLRVEGDEPADALQQLINPLRPISPGAQAVNGISAEMLRDAPIFHDVADRLLALCEGAVLVAHNAPFDLSFLTAEFAYAGLRAPDWITLDTLSLARGLLDVPSYSLGALAQALDVRVHGRAHRAMVDVLLTRGVFARLAQALDARGALTLGDYLRAQGGRIALPGAPAVDLPPAIERGLREGCLLWLRYVAEDGVESRRFVRPLAVQPQGGHWVLVAHCTLRDARRHFRLDRILEADVMTEDAPLL
ncbi:MAG: exonuclease domain-containing protein [Chloroflexota bacterium]